jgi:hydroxymethylglutaryl-coA synthase
MYSYGSGAVCEIFSITLVDGFKNQLINDRIKDFDERKRLSTSEYEKMFFEQIELDEYGNSINLLQDNSLFYLEKIENHKRIYKKRGY